MSENGLALEKFIDVETNETLKYSGAIPQLGKNGPELVVAEFSGSSDLYTVFAEYRAILEESQDKLRKEIQKMKAEENKPKIIRG